MNRLEAGLPPVQPRPKTPAPRRRRSRQTRSLILQSAVQLFAERPYEAVSLREITGLLQVNISLVKFYFGNKEALHLEALRYASQAGLEEVLRLPPPPRPEEPDAAGLAARALEANLDMFVALGLETRCPAGSGPAPTPRSAALALLGRALGSDRPEARQALGTLVAAHRDHLDGCVRALRPDLGWESRFRIGTSIVGQGLMFFLYPELVNGARGAAYDASSRDSLASHMTRFSLAAIEGYRAEPDAVGGFPQAGNARLPQKAPAGTYAALDS